MERQRANRKLLPDAFSDVSVIKCSHYRLIGTSMSQAARRFVFDKIQSLFSVHNTSSIMSGLF